MMMFLFFGAALDSNHDVLAEILVLKEDNSKQRLSYAYGIISACCLHLKNTGARGIAEITSLESQAREA